jgi:hypothetical protein
MNLNNEVQDNWHRVTETDFIGQLTVLFIMYILLLVSVLSILWYLDLRAGMVYIMILWLVGGCTYFIGRVYKHIHRQMNKEI